GLCTIAGLVIIRFVREDVQPKPEHPEPHRILGNYRYAIGSKPIRVALIVIMLSQSAVFMIQPIFALYVEQLVSNTEYIATMAGAIFSVAGVFTVLAAPWWGKRNDAKSYKKNLTIALSGAALAYSAQGLVTNAYQLIIFRAILGFCLGGMLPALYSYISKNTPLERRGSIMGIASSGNILANMIGPPTGGYIASHLGVRELFFVTGGLLLASVIFLRNMFVDMRGSKTAKEKELAEAQTTSESVTE
ncbi:MAG: MFS transporter, partial [Ignavibacteriae bacterium]|nr:MFS transporter [Ignavibacteriota bacterium]